MFVCLFVGWLVDLCVCAFVFMFRSIISGPCVYIVFHGFVLVVHVAFLFCLLLSSFLLFGGMPALRSIILVVVLL